MAEALRRTMDSPVAGTAGVVSGRQQMVAWARQQLMALGQGRQAGFTQEARRFLDGVLRQSIASGLVLSHGSLPNGLGMFLLQVAFVGASAVDAPLSAAQVSQALGPLSVLLDHPHLRPLLAKFKPALQDLFMNV